ncbi:MAG: hypothetical protein ACO1ON_12945 [Nocardioides sp.]
MADLTLHEHAFNLTDVQERTVCRCGAVACSVCDGQGERLDFVPCRPCDGTGVSGERRRVEADLTLHEQVTRLIGKRWSMSPRNKDVREDSTVILTTVAEWLRTEGARALERTHFDGQGCGTHGSNACLNCHGPSPMTAREVAAVLAEHITRGEQG